MIASAIKTLLNEVIHGIATHLLLTMGMVCCAVLYAMSWF